MAPHLRCRCVWALATLNHNPGKPWLIDFTAAAFAPSEVKALQPGDLSDAIWAIWTLDQTLDKTLDSRSERSGGSSSLITADLLQLAAKKLDKHVNELQPGQVLRLLQLSEGALDFCPEFSLPKGVSDQLSQVLSAKAAVIAEATGVIGLLWAAAKLKLRLHIGTLDQFCKKLYGQLEGLSAADMAKAFWASYELGYRWVLNVAAAGTCNVFHVANHPHIIKLNDRNAGRGCRKLSEGQVMSSTVTGMVTGCCMLCT